MAHRNVKSLATLDLHGYTTQEVPAAVDQFLMQAARRGLPQVRIMTGKGTGAVRKVVTAYLKLGGFPFEIEKLESGKANEGVLVVFTG